MGARRRFGAARRRVLLRRRERPSSARGVRRRPGLRDELHTIADTIRARFGQQSVLTFDRLPARDEDVDAIELDVPRVSADALRDGLLNDAEARERLFGGSVTQDEHLLLVASLDDAAFARDVRETHRRRHGARVASLRSARVRLGSATGPARPVARWWSPGTPDDDAIALSLAGGKLSLDGAPSRSPGRGFDRVRADLGDGLRHAVLHRRAERRQTRRRRRRRPHAADHATRSLSTSTAPTSCACSPGDGARHADPSATSPRPTRSRSAPTLGAGLDRATVNGSDVIDQISLGLVRRARADVRVLRASRRPPTG